MYQIDLRDITEYHIQTAVEIKFSVAHGISFKTDLILGHKASLNKFKNKDK
jgi:hypothetical protein